MGTVRRSVIALLALAAATAAAVPAGACACGVALQSSVTRERALVIAKPGREEIVASFDLVRDGKRPAVVFPIPGDPKVQAVEHSDPLAYLDAATSAAQAVGAKPGAGGETARPPVDVIGREEVGGYDVTRLRAGDPRALGRWLDANGYKLPHGAGPVLGEYVKRGWRFVAIRLAPGKAGRLKPLRVGFPTLRLVYPMRLTQLGTEPVDLTLYVAANSERTAAPLKRAWSGEVSELRPAPSGDLRRLLAPAHYLTKLEIKGASPASFKTDIRFGPVAKDASKAVAARDTGTGTGTEDGGGLPTWLILVAGCSVVLGVGYLLGRRYRT